MCSCCTILAPKLSFQMFLHLQEDFREALDMLVLAEESFQCCKDDLLKYIDNQGLLLMDIVWYELSHAQFVGCIRSMPYTTCS